MGTAEIRPLGVRQSDSSLLLEPVFLVSPSGLLYTATSRTSDRLLFLFTGRIDNGEGRDLVDSAYAAYLPHALTLANHNNQNDRIYREDEGFESEYKLTVRGETRPWDLAASTHELVGRGALEGFALHMTCSYTSWRFPNHLFEIIEPHGSAGYVSFVPLPDGTYIVKHKAFSQDAVRRREIRQRNIVVPDGLMHESAQRRAPGARVVYRGEFMREKYDVGVESLETGNHYLITFDRCTARDRSPLEQCEIEYIRSRTLFPVPMAAELRGVTSFAEGILRTRGLEYDFGTLSKLSWLGARG